MAHAPRYYNTEDHLAERQPLSHGAPSSPLRNQYPPDSFTSSPSRGIRPGAHPDSAFHQLRAQRRLSQEAGYHNSYDQPPDDHFVPPRPPPHRSTQRNSWGQGRPIPQSSTITPGADNFGNAAAGGMAGIALSVADQNARESGMNAVHDPHYPQQAYQQQGQWEGQGQGYLTPSASDQLPLNRNSHSSLQGLNSSPSGPGLGTPGQRTPGRPYTSGEAYVDDPNRIYRRPADPNLGVVNPHEIEDDGDDGLSYARRGPRTSMLSLGSSHKSRDVAAGGAAGLGAAGTISGLASRNGSGIVGNPTGYYAPVKNGLPGDASSGEFAPGAGGGGGTGYGMAYLNEKKSSPDGGKKKRLIIILVIVAIVLIGVAVGIVFGFVLKNKGGDKDNGGGGSSSGSTGSAEEDTATNGDLNINSKEIKALMNNPNLKKVFPGMDYTPIHSQYPDCVHYPPSQNNITRDLAVLSQLTNTVRLYGTDCNQTQMLIHAVEQLQLQDTVKIWLGVWQDGNATTNRRQLDQMWDILDVYGEKYFEGIIVANEILFREQMTIWTLGQLLADVRTNLTRKNINLPVATSDLGDKWDSTLAQQSDAIMGNIHPFFAGVPAAEATKWTMGFFVNKTGTYAKKDKKMNIIAETGWPSQGGMSCGSEYETNCPDKSVAGIKELNKFMEDWICTALNDGTNYFWFEAFDEPWKVSFNTPGKEWEDHWGLMDVNRNLKPGLKIPDCGGKRIS
ncbi:family 17 putative glycoside hydrolase [Podospora fimiseda]|uniref:glucan endo-1,3-beta-D-glucosidase n=1 Tax=Podospora fimiseda TaxID=252190 RepID=A0AAN7BXZ8_9PEZI|nr:family 17 putative glycoside hydrolase [Podospora fimiseda]